MRKGKNLSKDLLLDGDDVSHRVIIPLFIPREEDYYKDAFELFLYCIHSIQKTSVTNLKVSVVSNGCCASVNEKLILLFQENSINELIIEKTAIGKINSILKVLRTVEERFITITDADVLFDNEWDKEVFKIFEAFPKAGVVSPVPVFRTHLKLTSNIWFKYLFSDKLKFLPVKDPIAMTMFANSIGWPWLDIKYRDVIATLKAINGTIAVVGCSHFVGTYKKEVFSKLPKENSKYKLGGDSEYLYTDLPVLKMGGYRLATYGNYAYHLGNVIEDWMKIKFEGLSCVKKQNFNINDFPKLKESKFQFFLFERILQKLFYIKLFKILLFKSKGLTSDQIKNF